MLKLLQTAGALAALASLPLASAHSWIEAINHIAPNGTLVEPTGYPRGFLARGTPGFTGKENTAFQKANGPYAAIMGLPACLTGHQDTPRQSDGFPRLKASPGDLVAMRYTENGHVTKPTDKDPGPKRTPGGGSVMIYATTKEKPGATLKDLHALTNGGALDQGRLLSNQSYDDGRCYEDGGTPLGAQRQAQTPLDPKAQLMPGINAGQLPCQNDFAIPKDAPIGQPLTVYWVWNYTWTDPNSALEVYSNCIDIDVVASQGGTAQKALAPAKYDAAQPGGSAAVPSYFSSLAGGAAGGDGGATPAPSAPAAAPSPKPTNGAPANAPANVPAVPYVSNTASGAPLGEMTGSAPPPAASAPAPKPSAPAPAPAPSAPAPSAPAPSAPAPSAPAAGGLPLVPVGPVSIVVVPTQSPFTPPPLPASTPAAAPSSPNAPASLAPAPSAPASAPASASAPVPAPAPTGSRATLTETVVMVPVGETGYSIIVNPQPSVAPQAAASAPQVAAPASVAAAPASAGSPVVPSKFSGTATPVVASVPTSSGMTTSTVPANRDNSAAADSTPCSRATMVKRSKIFPTPDSQHLAAHKLKLRHAGRFRLDGTHGKVSPYINDAPAENDLVLRDASEEHSEHLNRKSKHYRRTGDIKPGKGRVSPYINDALPEDDDF